MTPDALSLWRARLEAELERLRRLFLLLIGRCVSCGLPRHRLLKARCSYCRVLAKYMREIE